MVASSVASLCNLDEMLDAEDLPPRPEGEEASTEDEEEDETNSSPEDDEDPKSPAV